MISFHLLPGKGEREREKKLDESHCSALTAMSYMISKSSLLNMPGYFIPRRQRPGTRPSGCQEAADSEAPSQQGPSCYVLLFMLLLNRNWDAAAH
jgi:hypothetical protein